MRLREIIDMAKGGRDAEGDLFDKRLKMLETGKASRHVQASLFRSFKNQPARRAA